MGTSPTRSLWRQWRGHWWMRMRHLMLMSLRFLLAWANGVLRCNQWLTHFPLVMMNRNIWNRSLIYINCSMCTRIHALAMHDQKNYVFLWMVLYKYVIVVQCFGQLRIGSRAHEIDAELSKVSDAITKINTLGVINGFKSESTTWFWTNLGLKFQRHDLSFNGIHCGSFCIGALRDQKSLNEQYRHGQRECLGLEPQWWGQIWWQRFWIHSLCFG